MKYAAFFRNLNLGRAHCPDKAGFERAFITAGAASASSFLTNGTMMFAADSQAPCMRVLADACANLAATYGMKEPGFVRSLDELSQLVALNPFANVTCENIHEHCVSFLPAECGPLGSLPLDSKRGDVRLLQRTDNEVLSLSLKIGKSPGSPNAFLEKLLGVAVTTRGWNTIVRLLQKHA